MSDSKMPDARRVTIDDLAGADFFFHRTAEINGGEEVDVYRFSGVGRELEIRVRLTSTIPGQLLSFQELRLTDYRDRIVMLCDTDGREVSLDERDAALWPFFEDNDRALDYAYGREPQIVRLRGDHSDSLSPDPV